MMTEDFKKHTNHLLSFLHFLFSRIKKKANLNANFVVYIDVFSFIKCARSAPNVLEGQTCIYALK